MNPIQRKEFLKSRFNSNECSQEELQELYFLIQKFGNEKELELLMEQSWLSENLDLLDDESTQVIYQNLRKRKVTSVKKADYNIIFKIAASVLIFATIGWYVFNYNQRQSIETPEISYITKTTKKGQRGTLKLSDGTLITLNAGSSITYPQTFFDSVRSVSLIGEAFFDVVENPDKPFVVESAGLYTMVLGTSFNINTFSDNIIDVTVASGRVMVYPKDLVAFDFVLDSSSTLSKILLPNQQASFNLIDNSISINEVDLKPYLAWKTHTLFFEMVPFKDVVKTLERWYNIDIIEQNNTADICLIRANYHTKESLENVLEGLKLLVEFDYEFDGPQKLIISAKGCKN